MPSTMNIHPTPLAHMTDHIMTLVGCFIVARVGFGEPLLQHTNGW